MASDLRWAASIPLPPGPARDLGSGGGVGGPGPDGHFRENTGPSATGSRSLRVAEVRGAPPSRGAPAFRPCLHSALGPVPLCLGPACARVSPGPLDLAAPAHADWGLLDLLGHHTGRKHRHKAPGRRECLPRTPVRPTAPRPGEETGTHFYGRDLCWGGCTSRLPSLAGAWVSPHLAAC